MFSFASSCEILQAVKVYVGSHYGSNLWILDSNTANQYHAAWRTCVKLAWQMPRTTHTYLVDHLLSCGMTSVKTDIISRFSKFLWGLKNSVSKEVRIMCLAIKGDVQSSTGYNRNLIKNMSGKDPA